MAGLAFAGTTASAQGDLNCGDFRNQAEAQASLNESYPDDPNRLDADKDWVACEDFFGLTDEEAAREVGAVMVEALRSDAELPQLLERIGTLLERFPLYPGLEEGHA